MPIITIQTIKGVVLTSDEQKRDLLKKMTDTFISVVGELARPYTYCLIQETPLYEWSLAGVPLPDLPFLYGPEYAAMHANANAVMRAYVESQGGGGGGNGASSDPDPAGGSDPESQAAQQQWAAGSGGS
ncbi:MAG TPA: tautomerase family protein [Acidimicrobiales bacterium]|nr:tautomerase family protein [Acidimicrobiales bacterium]